MATSVLEGVS